MYRSPYLINCSDPSLCCGCRACEHICPKHAIVFNVDKEGFLYPNVNIDKCINCGLCADVCPMLRYSDVLNEEGEVYAVQNTDKRELSTSSSGGVFITIAKYVISNNGVVYGAAYQGSPYVAHERVDCIADLERLKGSKYVQSDTCETYIQIKRDLSADKMVFFAGTPCQVAGLKLFLKKKYEKLITADIICHGTPSPLAFSKLIREIERRTDGVFVDYSFRDKRIHGWSCSSSAILQKKNGRKYYIYMKEMEAYFNAFISGDLMRFNCYHCPFAQIKRCGDFTLGDFWGIKKIKPDFPEIRNGVSLLIINSEKGSKIFDSIKKHLFVIPQKMIDAARYNPNLSHPTELTKGRFKVYDLLIGNFSEFVKLYYRGNYYYNKIKTIIEFFIRSNPRLFSMLSLCKKYIKR